MCLIWFRCFEYVHSLVDNLQLSCKMQLSLSLFTYVCKRGLVKWVLFEFKDQTNKYKNSIFLFPPHRERLGLGL